MRSPIMTKRRSKPITTSRLSEHRRVSVMGGPHVAFLPREAGEGDHAKHGGGGAAVGIIPGAAAPSTALSRGPPPPSATGEDNVLPSFMARGSPRLASSARS